MSDDRWSDEEKAAHEAAKLKPIPVRCSAMWGTERCDRRAGHTGAHNVARTGYRTEWAVSADEIEAFVKELEKE